MNAKKILINAIANVVTKKPFDQITVQDILDEAEISRGTFYKYFKDKYEVANAYYETYVTNNILTKYNGSNWEQLVCEILIFVKNNLTYFNELNTSKGVNTFMHFLTNYSYSFFKSVYMENRKTTTLTKIEEYKLWFVTGSNIMTLEKWMENGCDVNPYLLGKEMISMMPEEYFMHVHKKD